MSLYLIPASLIALGCLGVVMVWDYIFTPDPDAEARERLLAELDATCQHCPKKHQP